MNGLTLKKNREKFGLTQEQLASFIEVSRKTINTYENNGNIPKSKVKLLEKIFEEMGTNVTKNNGIINNGNAKKINQNNNNVAGNNNFDKIVEVFQQQLSKKDEQIDKLLDMLSKQ